MAKYSCMNNKCTVVQNNETREQFMITVPGPGVYYEYLDWVAEGNEPDKYDGPNIDPP